MFLMTLPISMHSGLIRLAKRYRRWVFGISVKFILGYLGLGFLTLATLSLGHADPSISAVVFEIFVTSFMLLIAAHSLGWLCDAFTSHSLAESAILLVMGLCGLAFSGWQVSWPCPLRLLLNPER